MDKQRINQDQQFPAEVLDQTLKNLEQTLAQGLNDFGNDPEIAACLNAAINATQTLQDSRSDAQQSDRP